MKLIAYAVLLAVSPILIAGQNAGTGAGCDSIFTQGDNASGYGVENAENNVAATITSLKGGRRLRQNAGTGSACNSIFKNTDDATGYGVENAENNVATDLGGHPMTGAGTGRKLSADKAGRTLKQLDKMVDGAANIGNAAGATQQSAIIKQIGDSADGDLTNDLAADGAQIGQLEVDTIEPAGKLVPGRRMLALSGKGRTLKQLDKMVDGDANIGNAAGATQQSAIIKQIGDSADGDLTNDLAADGAQIGQLEVDTIEPAGKLVPGK